MSRAVLLPAWGDPFLLKLWLHLFETIWQDEVDKVYVLLDNKGQEQAQFEKVDQFIIKFMTKNPKIEVKQNPNNDWISQFKNLIVDCKEDLFVFIQEDAFVFKKGTLDEQFKKIEEGEVDFIASSLGGRKDSFHTFWLNWFFAKTRDILATDMDFNLGVKNDEVYDMMGSVHIQLQERGLRFNLVSQYTEGWHHATQLSNIRQYLYRNVLLSPSKSTGTYVEITRRLGWWLSCWELFHEECSEIENFSKEYKKAAVLQLRSVLP